MVTTEDVQRRLSEVLERFEQLANRLDTTYIRRDIFDAYKELMTTKFDAAKAEKDALGRQLYSEKDAMELRIKVLEEDKATKGRLIWGAFISAVASIAVAVVLGLVLHHSGR